jgi:hypothetical protein
MRLGVKYDRKNGFYVSALTDLQEVANILETATGKPVVFLFKCFICGKEMTCSDCEYSISCRVERTGGRCMCSECAKERGAEEYFKRWASFIP